MRDSHEFFNAVLFLVIFSPITERLSNKWNSSIHVFQALHIKKNPNQHGKSTVLTHHKMLKYSKTRIFYPKNTLKKKSKVFFS